MGNKDTFRNLLIAGAVFFTLMWVGQSFFPPPSRRGKTTSPSSRLGPPAGEKPGLVSGDSVSLDTRSRAGRSAEKAEQSSYVVRQAEAAELVAIGSAEDVGQNGNPTHDPYRMRLVLSNVGASVERATMTDHREELKHPDRYRLLAPLERDDGERLYSLPIERVNIDGVDVWLHDKFWNIDGPQECSVEVDRGESLAGQCASFSIQIDRKQEPVLKVTRTFRLPQQPKKFHRHDFRSDITIANLSDEQHVVLLTYLGGVGVRRASTRADDRVIDHGVFGETGVVTGSRISGAKVHSKADESIKLFSRVANDPSQRLAWASSANTYFTCTLTPLRRDGTDNASYIAELAAIDLDGDASTSDDATFRLATAAETLEPRGSLAYPAEIYMGEKEFDGFRTIEKYKARNFYYQISQGYGSCTFTWLVEFMIWLLNTLFFLVRDFGVAIIILVLLVRGLLHPITKKGQINMVRMQHRMQEVAPKIEEIKRKYANDKARMNQEMMKLNINPAGQILSCLPMAIQMPIWVALWISLSNNIPMRLQPFHGTWIHDLTAPDALMTFASPITLPLVGWQVASFNLLPFLLAVAMYAQQKLQPKPKPNPNATDQQRQQQDMMQKMGPMMSVMMFVIFYNAPAGLTLYIMASSMFGAIEQHRIRKHIRQREEDGTLHKPASKVAKDGPKKRGKPSFFQRLQKMAEDAQKVQSQGKRR